MFNFFGSDGSAIQSDRVCKFKHCDATRALTILESGKAGHLASQQAGSSGKNPAKRFDWLTDASAKTTPPSVSNAFPPPLTEGVRLGDSSRTQTHRVTLLWSLRKTSRLLATNCTIQSDKGTRFGLRSQVVPLPWMILRTSRRSRSSGASGGGIRSERWREWSVEMFPQRCVGKLQGIRPRQADFHWDAFLSQEFQQFFGWPRRRS
ncbi:unnamed protein product [Gadus morhua 'NCC']